MAYPLPGDSDEVKNLIAFALQVPGARITSTTNHGILTRAGFISYHRRQGTNGNGLAIDVAGTDMKAIFQAFEQYSGRLHELIHTPMGYSYKDGRRVSPIAASSHYNHVHISMGRNTRLPITPTQPGDSVATEFNPPFNIQNVVASEKSPNGGCWVLDASGAIFAFEGAPHVGAANGQPYFAGCTAKRLEANGRGGYDIIDATDHRYSYPV